MNPRIIHKYVKAWEGGDPYVAGWHTVTIKEYANGDIGYKPGPTKYVYDHPDKQLAHAIFLMAERELKDDYF
mgnify:CR=1 FL=1